MDSRHGIAVVFAVLAAAAGAGAPSASAAFGIAEFNGEVRASPTPGDVLSQAGATPFAGVTDISFNRTLLLLPDGAVKDVRVDLPPGVVSNPQATPKCTDAQFPSCPAETEVGTEQLTTALGLPLPLARVYNMEPKPGQISLFAFNTILGRTDIVGGVRDDGDYGLFFTIAGVPQFANLVRSVLTFWGKPPGSIAPFITLPTSCGGPLTTTVTAHSYAGETATAAFTTPHGPTGCDALPLAPQVSATTRAAAAGRRAGLRVRLTQGAGEANLRSVSVTLPAGVGVSLETLKLACPAATFAADPSGCPAASRVGGTSARTPLLAAPLTGDIYMEAHDRGQLPTLELILRGPGLRVSLSGRVDLSHGVTSTFDGIPDLPISEIVIDLPAGPGSPLVARADLCTRPGALGTAIVAQSGKRQEGRSPVGVSGCRLQLVSAKARGTAARLTLRTPAAGQVTLRGKGLVNARRGAAGTRLVVVTTRLSRAGLAALGRARSRHRALTRVATVRFAPSPGASAGGEPVPASAVTMRLRFR